MANKDELIISKSNPLLNMKNDFDLYQQRMINLYLAKINPLDEKSRHVSVTLAQFVRLIGIKEVSARKMRALAERALGLRVDLYEVETDDNAVHVPDSGSGVRQGHFFVRNETPVDQGRKAV